LRGRAEGTAGCSRTGGNVERLFPINRDRKGEGQKVIDGGILRERIGPPSTKVLSNKRLPRYRRRGRSARGKGKDAGKSSKKKRSD